MYDNLPTFLTEAEQHFSQKIEELATNGTADNKQCGMDMRHAGMRHLVGILYLHVPTNTLKLQRAQIAPPSQHE